MHTLSKNQKVYRYVYFCVATKTGNDLNKLEQLRPTYTDLGKARPTYTNHIPYPIYMLIN